MQAEMHHVSVGEDAHEWQAEPKLMQAPNGYELAARTMLGKDDVWQACRWEVVAPDVVKVCLGRVVRRLSTGRRVWGKEKLATAFVTDARRGEALREWEARCGSCSECGGDGREFRGWSKARGYCYVQCRLCGGDGKPRSVTPGVP